MEKMYLEAGFPKDTFQALLYGAKTTERLIKEDGVVGVSLTGSVAAGSKIGSLTGKYLREVILGSRSCDPLFVFFYADLEKAACAAVKSRTNNAGQSCVFVKGNMAVHGVGSPRVR